MPVIIKQTMVWTGFIGAPGYSSFYHRVGGSEPAAEQAGHNAVANFASLLQGLIPGDVILTVDPLWQALLDTTGEVVAEGTVATPAEPVAGTVAGGWAGNTGYAIEWVTGTFIGGRRLRGRTYVVPGAGGFDVDGTLTPGTLTALATAALAIVAAEQDFVVWHRPAGTVAGSSVDIASANVRDHAYILRSRAR